MVPEISQRCTACGVSVREYGEGVLFCPECGKPLAPRKTNSKQTAGEAKTAAYDASIETAATAATHPETDETDKSVAVADVPLKGERKRTRGKLHRASSVARGAIEDNVKRVEKIHHVSSVMLEEASYDPSLRFVLVAVGLFVLFIILLVLSKVMG